jgi:RecJ-like exonuclease
MKEKTLLKIAIISSLIGILILLYISEHIEIKEFKISEITRDKLDERVKIKGDIIAIKETPGLYILTLKDKTSSIPIVIFKEEPLSLEHGMLIEIQGIVIEYKGIIEIQAEEIKII